MKKNRTIILFSIILLFVAIITYLLFKYIPTLNEVYDKKLQTPLFTGFLTLGGFLLTLKTFLVVQVKEKLYDTKEYIEKIAELRIQNSKLELYRPLTNLAEFLLIAVIMSIGTSFLQITIGFIGCQITSAICVSFALATLILVGFAWWQIRMNIYDLFDSWGKIKEEEIKAKQEELLKKSKTKENK